MNSVVIRSEDGTIKHYGIRGMKWDEKKVKKKTEKLEKLVSKTIKRHDSKGLFKIVVTDEDLEKVATKVRSEKAAVDKKIKKAEKFLEKARQADAKELIFNFDTDPAKRKAVEHYLKTLKMNSTTLSELRTQMMDVRLSEKNTER